MINPFPSSLLAPYNTSITFLQRTYATLSCHDAPASCICDVAVILYTHTLHISSHTVFDTGCYVSSYRTHALHYLFIRLLHYFHDSLIRATTPSSSPLIDQPRCTATTPFNMHIFRSTERSNLLYNVLACSTLVYCDRHGRGLRTPSHPFAALLITIHTFLSYPLRCLFLPVISVIISYWIYYSSSILHVFYINH